MMWMSDMNGVAFEIPQRKLQLWEREGNERPRRGQSEDQKHVTNQGHENKLVKKPVGGCGRQAGRKDRHEVEEKSLRTVRTD